MIEGGGDGGDRLLLDPGPGAGHEGGGREGVVVGPAL